MKKFLFLLFTALHFFTAPLPGQGTTSVVVKIDPRLELFTILEYLGGHIHYVIPSDYEYAMKKHFWKYRHHPAVKAIPDLMDEKYIENDFPFLSLYFDDVSSMKQVMPITDSILLANLKTKNLDQYAEQVKDFVVKSHFEQFYADQEPNFMRWKTEVWSTMSKYQFRKKLVEFYGSFKSLTICLSPLVSMDGQVFLPNAGFADSCIFFRLGYSTFKEGYSSKKNPPVFNDKEKLERLIWHEGSHAFINPLVDKNFIEFLPAEKLFTPELQLKLQQAGAFNWTYEGFLKEQIVRGVTTYLIRTNDSIDIADRELARQEEIGFIYTRELVNLFYNYTLERNKYPFIESFFPQVYRYFNSKVE